MRNPRPPRRQRGKDTVLITGFGPFPGVPVNASAELAVRLARAAGQRYPHLRFVAAVLPVSWHGAPARLARLIARHRPLLALHIGVSPFAEGFVLERVARNHAATRPDHRSLQPVSACLCIGGAAERGTTLPVAKLERALRAARVPAVSSDDAGDYLCNAILYHSLAASARARATQRLVTRKRGGHLAGFVHIPTGLVDDGRVAPPLGPQELLRGALTILGQSLPHVRAKVNRP